MPAENHYFIRFMASQGEEVLKVFKGCKAQAIQSAIRAMKEGLRIIATNANVGNHLRIIKKRWERFKKLKEISGVGWDNGLKMIAMDEDKYRDYIQVFLYL